MATIVKSVKCLYDSSLDLLNDVNQNISDPQGKETLNILLTGVLRTLNDILTDSVKNADN
jgi:hypothetical protein